MKFVRCRHPEVEGEATLPVSALPHLPGWEPIDPTDVVSTATATVTQVLADVGDDPVKAAAALEAERSSTKPRKSLVEGLSRILENPEN